MALGKDTIRVHISNEIWTRDLSTPPGVQPPPLWGNVSHVRTLFGDDLAAASFTRARVATPPQISTPVEFREFFKIHYGPTIAVYDALAGRPDARAALDREFERFLAETDARVVGTSTAQGESRIPVDCRRQGVRPRGSDHLQPQVVSGSSTEWLRWQ
jgi:hypothetical protein